MLESERGPNDPDDPEQDEYLMTPALNLTKRIAFLEEALERLPDDVVTRLKGDSDQ